jgi:hypothetical protein
MSTYLPFSEFDPAASAETLRGLIPTCAMLGVRADVMAICREHARVGALRGCHTTT